ncbi:ACP S-malonyltransferase [Aquihabitans sp. McL0605]|uniref:ACP S-malonyltransferase n=1 Tax=Aquihabitans sp. McL0605 TaxID=3415671 RepID=UPI003CF5DA5D
MSLAITFPGQGAQTPGLGAPWRDHPAWSIVDDAERATGRPLAHLLLDAPAEELADTRHSQLAVLLASLLAWTALEPRLDEPVVAMAGHSLGQITALIASGTVAFDHGMRLAVARADASADAQAHAPGGLVVLLGAEEDVAVAACDAAPGRAWLANVNAPGQVVVGGHADGLDAVAARAKELGARRATRLPVGGAFHTPMLVEVAEAIGPVLDETPFVVPAIPVVANDDGAVVADPAAWPDRLRTHLVRPVRWTDTVRTMRGLGADTLIEVGPGSTLTGLARRIDPELELANVAVPDDLAALGALVHGAVR